MIIPLPYYDPDERQEKSVLEKMDNSEWIKWYMNCPNWKCTCGATNFGRNVRCAKPTCRKERDT